MEDQFQNQTGDISPPQNQPTLPSDQSQIQQPSSTLTEPPIQTKTEPQSVPQQKLRSQIDNLVELETQNVAQPPIPQPSVPQPQIQQQPVPVITQSDQQDPAVPVSAVSVDESVKQVKREVPPFLKKEKQAVEPVVREEIVQTKVPSDMPNVQDVASGQVEQQTVYQSEEPLTEQKINQQQTAIVQETVPEEKTIEKENVLPNNAISQQVVSKPSIPVSSKVPATMEQQSQTSVPVVKEVPEVKQETITPTNEQKVANEAAALSQDPTPGVDVSEEQFVEKLDLDPQAQQVFEQATQAKNPEQIFDAVENKKDQELAQKLEQSGLPPELVQKALNEKKQHLQEEVSSVPPHQVSEVTTESAKAVLGEDEYQKEQAQSLNQSKSQTNTQV